MFDYSLVDDFGWSEGLGSSGFTYFFHRYSKTGFATILVAQTTKNPWAYTRVCIRYCENSTCWYLLANLLYLL